MKLSDIIALAKAGYSVSEVKELMALEQPAQTDTEPKQPEQTETEPKQPAQTETEPKQPAQTEPEPDYKKLYEKAKEDLAKAQKDNLKKAKKEDGDDDDEKLLSDLVSSFI